jgi:AraC-like DNA-binding protein
MKKNRKEEIRAVSTLSEIAGYCGFHDIHHFHKMFKRETGITPKQYRDRMKM